MPQNDTRRKDERSDEADEAYPIISPENEGHEKGQPGMPRKEIIPASCQVGEHICRIEIGVLRYGPEMGEHDENRPHEDEKRRAFQNERDLLGLEKNNHPDKNTEQYRSLVDDKIDIKYRKIIEKKIRYRIARP